MKKIVYLDEFNYFRGISIFLVVLGHMLAVFDPNLTLLKTLDSFYLYRSLANIIWGGTALFVFISGFLFYYIFYQRGFKYISFIKNKVKNVLCPYLFMVLCLALVKWFYRYVVVFRPWDNMNDFLGNTFWHWSFWYVPFIMLVFVCSKLYLIFIRMRFNYQLFVLFSSMIVSIFIGRNNFSPLQSMLHFSVFYLLGILCAQYYEKILAIRMKIWWMLIILYGILIYAYALNNQYISIDRTVFLSNIYLLDFLVITKMWMCFLSICIFNYFKQTKFIFFQKVIAILAQYSFSVFFLHNFVILFTEKFLQGKGILFHSIGTVWSAAILYTILTCIICVLLAAKSKALTGKYSRYFIGA